MWMWFIAYFGGWLLLIIFINIAIFIYLFIGFGEVIWQPFQFTLTTVITSFQAKRSELPVGR